MEWFLIAQQDVTVETFYQNGECAMQAVRKLRTIFGRNEAPFESTLRRPVMMMPLSGVAPFNGGSRIDLMEIARTLSI